jgi:peptidyl-prolyl cis-trans isomerase D
MLQKFRDRIVNIWVAGGIIGLIAITFIFWGVDFNLGGATYAARVNGDEISLRDFDREYQNELYEYQEMYQSDLDEGLRTELRRNVLERMIELRAMQHRIRDAGYYVSEDRLVQYIASIPMFQVDGRFSTDIYRAQLRFQGFTPAGFEAQQRMQLEIMEFRNGLFDSTFMAPNEFRRYIELYFQQRELSYALFPVDAFMDRVDVDDEAVALHYNANRDRYRTPEAVELEYLEVRLSDIAAEIEVTDELLRDYYERNRDRFETVEERRARHVLVSVGADGEEAARARAEEALERIRAGEEFADVAADMSDDVGTRNAGGDLGWVPRGMLGDAFEEALYELQTGEVSEPVRSSFGYDVIRLDNVRAGDTVPFESIRDELYEDYSRDMAEGRYFDQANELADRAFDAYDQLGTVAAQSDLSLRTLERFTRAGDDVFDNSAPVVQAAFSSDSLERRLNSQLLELSDDQVVVVRVREHFPPAERPLDDVYDEIVEELTLMRAEELARQAADEFHAQAQDMAIADQLAAARDALSTPVTAIDADDGAEEADAETAAVDEDDSAHALAALAERLGGAWVGPRWVEQSAGDVPTQIMASAFTMPRLREGDAPRDQRVALASGDQAVLFVSGHRPGQPSVIPQDERDFLQRELADRAAVEELLAYASEVREQARVRIPAGVLEEPDFFLD